MRETYHISAIAGSSGNFILVLLRSFLQKEPIVYEFPEGHAHNLTYEVDLGLFLMTHVNPDWERIRTNDTKNNIIITITPNMYHRINANCYFKNVVPNSTPEYIRDYWESFPEVTTTLLECDIPNIPNEELNLVFSNASKKMKKVGYPFNESDVIPDDVKNKIYILNLHDIIHNKNIILETLSDFTQRPITEHIRQTYDNYLTAQQRLMPWLDDSVYY
jgi:hypothetical protein